MHAPQPRPAAKEGPLHAPLAAAKEPGNDVRMKDELKEARDREGRQEQTVVLGLCMDTMVLDVDLRQDLSLSSGLIAKSPRRG